MNFIDIISIVGASWGFLFVMFLFLNKGIHTEKPMAKYILVLITLMHVHYLIESVVDDELKNIWLNLSYLYWHLIGFLVLLYVSFFLKTIRIPRWAYVSIILFTIIRVILVLLFYIEYKSEQDLLDDILYVYADYIILLIVNSIPLFYLFFKIWNVKKFAPKQRESQLEVKWISYLIAVFILLYVVNIMDTAISIYFFKPEFFLQVNTEVILTSFVFFVFAIIVIRVPVFRSIETNSQNEESTSIKKYSSSSLSNEKSELLWTKIVQLMETEKPYRNPEFRLNLLVECLEENLHHVSQVINEKEGLSFFDFVNKYRVSDAKDLLTSEKGKQFKILAIAFEVGFNSKTTFYSAFKKETGMTPSAYKKAHEKP